MQSGFWEMSDSDRKSRMEKNCSFLLFAQAWDCNHERTELQSVHLIKKLPGFPSVKRIEPTLLSSVLHLSPDDVFPLPFIPTENDYMTRPWSWELIMYQIYS